MTGNIPPKPEFPKMLFFGTRVMPVLFMIAGIQIAVTNYINPMTDEQRKEIEETRRGRGFRNSRLEKKSHSYESQEDILSKDDSRLFQEGKLDEIDLSHLDQELSPSDRPTP